MGLDIASPALNTPAMVFNSIDGIILIYLDILIVIGASHIVIYQRSNLFPLLLNHNYHNRFWSGIKTIAKDFLIMLEVPPYVGNRVIILALLATIADASFFSMYFNSNRQVSTLKHNTERLVDDLPYRYQKWFWKHKEVFEWSLIIYFPISLFLINRGLHWSRKMRHSAQKRALLSAEQVRLKDPRRPVLFLRSFRDDQVTLSNANVPRILRFLDPGVVAGMLEHLLVREFPYLVVRPVQMIPIRSWPPARRCCRR
jgi:hypothetical protein